MRADKKAADDQAANDAAAKAKAEAEERGKQAATAL